MDPSSNADIMNLLSFEIPTKVKCSKKYYDDFEVNKWILVECTFLKLY